MLSTLGYILGTATVEISADQSNSTVNGIASKVLGIILVVLIIVFSGKMIAMFQQRQYAQLIVLFLVGSFAFWFVLSPSSFITTMNNLLNGLFGASSSSSG